jgi:hypothetical protein
VNGPSSQRSLCLLGLSLLSVTACSPLARLELTFQHAGGPLDPQLFRLTARKACPPAALAAVPPAAPGPAGAGADEWQTVTATPGGLLVATAFRGVRCSVRVTGFYDTNRDGAVNAGDLTAASPEIEVADRGLFRGNLTVGPRLTLAPIR